MGNCFSDPSKGGQRLGSALSSSPAGRPQAPSSAGGAPSAAHGRGRTLSESTPQSPGGVETGNDPRAAAAAAAEARAQAANNRGVSTAKPGAGRLSSKLQEERRTGSSGSPQGNPNERMMDSGQWN